VCHETLNNASGYYTTSGAGGVAGYYRTKTNFLPVGLGLPAAVLGEHTRRDDGVVVINIIGDNE